MNNTNPITPPELFGKFHFCKKPQTIYPSRSLKKFSPSKYITSRVLLRRLKEERSKQGQILADICWKAETNDLMYKCMFARYV